MNQPI